MILFWPNYKAEGGPSFINGASRSRINDQLSLDFEGYIVGWKFEHIVCVACLIESPSINDVPLMSFLGQRPYMFVI